MSAVAIAAAALFRADQVPGPRVFAPVNRVPVAQPVPPPVLPPSAEVAESVTGPRLSADAVEQALDAAEPGTRDLVIERDLAVWVEENPQAAARFAELRIDSSLREVAVRTVAQNWARADSQAAAQWATSLGDPIERDRAVETVALELSAVDARAALSLLEARSQVGQIDTARVGVIANWAERDFDAAVAWAVLQSGGPTHDEILQRLVLFRAATDPSGAAQLADRVFVDLHARRQSYASIARIWASADPQRVRSWADTLDADSRMGAQAEIELVDRRW
jgi:hypothetical protein